MFDSHLIRAAHLRYSLSFKSASSSSSSLRAPMPELASKAIRACVGQSDEKMGTCNQKIGWGEKQCPLHFFCYSTRKTNIWLCVEVWENNGARRCGHVSILSGASGGDNGLVSDLGWQWNLSDLPVVTEKDLNALSRQTIRYDKIRYYTIRYDDIPDARATTGDSRETASR